MRLSLFLSIFALMAPSAVLNAQACNKGPGSAFGVTGYTCTECRIEWDKESAQRYTFTAAPVVLSTTPASVLQRGDVIEAIDGSPITTKQGAQVFARPQDGEHTITVRRNRARTEVRARALSCEGDQPNSDLSVTVKKYPNPLTVDTINGRPMRPLNEPVFTITKVEPAPSESQSKFGFAVACIPSCTKVTGSGVLKVAYWKYDNYPQIAALRTGGPAERAGLRNGDVVAKVDGFSVLEEKGALKLFQSEGATALNITVLRDGKEVQAMLRAMTSIDWQHLLDRGGQHVWFDSTSISRNDNLLSVRVRWVEDRLDGKAQNQGIINNMEFVCATRTFRVTATSYEKDDKSRADRPNWAGTGVWVSATPGLLEGLILDALCGRFGPGKTLP